MNEDQTLRMTELDHLIGSHRMQLLKAALPYMKIPQQKVFSLMVKFTELERTAELFNENESGQVGICSLDEASASPIDMLNTLKTYANEPEQDFIDLMVNFMQGASLYRSFKEEFPEKAEKENPLSNPFEHLKALLPPEQQSRFEDIQMMRQMVQQFS